MTVPPKKDSPAPPGAARKPAGAAGAPGAPAAPASAAETAKAALRRLAMAKKEPTPENYAQAWAEETGQPAAGISGAARAKPVFERLVARVVDDTPSREALVGALLQADWEEARRLAERAGDSQLAQSQAWAQTLEKLARGLERHGRQWTAARKRDSLQRVLDGNRSDFGRLQQRLKQLVASWDDDTDDGTVAGEDTPAAAGDAESSGEGGAADHGASLPNPWSPVARQFGSTLRSAFPAGDARADALAAELDALMVTLDAPTVAAAVVVQVDELCERARRLLSHRHHLLDQLHRLAQELAAGLTELAEDDSWARGQSESLAAHLADAPSVRAVRAASDMLALTRQRQRQVRADRDSARVALKDLIQQMLTELGALGETTGRFSESMQRYVTTVEHAESLESLADVVREMVAESRTVHSLVSSTQARLQDGHARASQLEERVQTLEEELRRLSAEVSTDLLTEIANRRGLMQAFEIESARIGRQGGVLAVGLLDIDNFKKLNDSLGHAAGDQALKALAGHVQQQLREVDVVARFGGEEFVVLLPGSPVDEAQATLTRLQRTLSASLFMHDGREVFVTFSAGVTAWREGEPLEASLERADEALYEAKRTGKNRTCIG